MNVKFKGMDLTDVGLLKCGSATYHPTRIVRCPVI